MAKFNTTITFSDGDQVTSDKLNEIISGLSFGSDAVVGTSLAIVGGQIKVNTITASEMGALSVATGSLQDASVTTIKIADGSLSTAKYGNLSITAEKIASGTLTLTQFSSTIIAGRTDVQNITPGKLVDAENVGYAPGCCKSSGGFSISSTSRVVRANSFNFQGVTRLSSTQTQVVFLAPMNSGVYCAVASFESDGSETGEVAVYDREATGFKIKHPVEASGRGISFVVFGKFGS